MTIVCPSASDRRFCTMRAMTSVPPPGGYGTMKRTGFAGQSCAHAGIAASRPSTRTIPFFIAASSVGFLRLAGRQFQFCSQCGLHTAIFRLDFGKQLAGFFGVSTARRRLDVLAIPAQHARAEVRAARFERMRGAYDLRRIIGGRRLLQFLYELRRLDQVKIDRAGEPLDRKSTRLNSSHSQISYAVFCLKKKKTQARRVRSARHHDLYYATQSVDAH